MKFIERLIEKIFDFLFDHVNEMENNQRIQLNQMWRKEQERRRCKDDN